MIDLLSAIVRLQGSLLRQMVEEWVPAMVAQQWWRNLSVIGRMVRRVEGARSELLDEILQGEWCTPEVEALILEIRGM